METPTRNENGRAPGLFLRGWIMSTRLILVATATVIVSFPQLFAAPDQPSVRTSSVSVPRLIHGVPEDTRAALPHPGVPAVFVMARSAQAAPAWRVAILGDLLATGYGIGASAAYPRVLERIARDAGWPIEVSIWAANGHTTADGLANAHDIARWAPHVAVVALGGNDALRGTPAPTVRANLDQLLATLRPSSSYLVVAGMRGTASARRGPRRGLPSRVSGCCRRLRCGVDAVPARGRGRPSRVQPSRWRASERDRRTYRRRQPVAVRALGFPAVNGRRKLTNS